MLKATFFRMIYMAGSFLAMLLISAMAGRAAFGEISICIVNAALMILVTGMGHDSSLLWHHASGKLDLSESLGYALLATIKQLLLYFIITFVFFYWRGYLPLSRMGIGFFKFELAYFIGLVLLDRYVSLYYSSGLSVQGNKLLAFSSGLIVALLAVSWKGERFFTFTPFEWLCIYTFSQALLLALGFHMIKKHVTIKIPKKGLMRSLFGFSFIVVLTNLVQFLAYRLDYWLIDHFIPATGDLGVYAQANRMAQLLWVIPGILATLFYGYLSNRESGYGPDELLRGIRLLNMMNFLLMGVLWFFSWGIFGFLLPEYVESVRLLIWLLPGMYLFAINILLAAYFASQRLLKINLSISVICLVVISLLDFRLIPVLGIKGAAISNSIAYSLSGIISIGVFKKYHPASWADLLFIRKGDWDSFKFYFFRK